MIKAFSKVSKQLLLDLCKSKYLSDKEASAEPEYKDYRKCKYSCPWYWENKTTCEVCHNCPFILSTSSIKTIKKDALTFTQIKQLLLYHSLIFENNGITPLINHKYVADKINCTIKTARENIKALERAGYIVVSYNKSSYVAFIIKYAHYHEENRGYLNFNNKLLDAILKTNDINQLRLALYCSVKLDDMKVAFCKSKKNKKNRPTPIKKFTYENLLNMLPSYVYRKQQLISMLKELSNCLNIFNIKFEEDNIIITESNKGNVTFLKAIDKRNKKTIKMFISKFKLILDTKEIDDLKQMLIQYNPGILKKALAIYKIRIKNKENLSIDKHDEILPVTNLGGYLRTIIKNEITANLSLIIA